MLPVLKAEWIKSCMRQHLRRKLKEPNASCALGAPNTIYNSVLIWEVVFKLFGLLNISQCFWFRKLFSPSPFHLADAAPKIYATVLQGFQPSLNEKATLTNANMPLSSQK